MNRLAVSMLLALATGCAGQVASSSSSSSGGGGGPAASPDECQHGATESCVQSGNANVGVRTCEVGQQGYVWGACEAPTCTGTQMTCTTPDGQAGLASCFDGTSASACGAPGACNPGDQNIGSDGCGEVCAVFDGTWQWQNQSCGTPLVLSFDRGHVEFTRASGEFDVEGVQASVGTAWVSARTPWLAIDLDGNGRIDDGRELFGSMTVLPLGRRAPNGFVALGALDDDHDGRITERDAAFDRLMLWRDDDQDRRSEPDELVPAREAGLVSIALDHGVAPRCDDGDCEVERATFTFRDAAGVERTGAVIDVHLAARAE